MLVTDQATAEYACEQENRARLEDDWASWMETEQPCPTPELVPQKVCAQCVNWRHERHLHLADGTRQTAPGFCTARAAADLQQMSPDYAERCRFYKEYIPF
ncbi:MAG: hypothetical protein DCF15_13920 [Phormidesmis priestleyi]|uniref:Uncharacterized protein n=1 Tax=Phormidesmis priestleyi TaxID=268141 RepID=A0A2W4X6W0_9CYAN|nr:MAG: hypothetical protein DCF15_13920 [Phormidesmis priestleyi]